MRRYLGGVLVALVVASSACSLTEVTTTAAEDIVVVEALFQLNANDVTPTRLNVFLHRTVQGEGGLSGPVDGAEVQVKRQRDEVITLRLAEVDDCVVTTPPQGTGSCYIAPAFTADDIRPGERLELSIRTAEGEVIEAVSTVPERFQLATADDRGTCRVEPNDPLEIVWSPSEGAWSYVSEISIRGLPEALPELSDIEVPDPLFLLGLSISAADTTIVAPNEFGVVDRFDLDQPLAVALQEGLPAGSRAFVSVAAVDRNYVNWVRGGGFNPSGQVRIPSVRGDGTGFFGSGVVRTFRMVTEGDVELCRRFDEVESASPP